MLRPRSVRLAKAAHMTMFGELWREWLTHGRRFALSRARNHKRSTVPPKVDCSKVLIRTQTQALLKVLGRRKGEAFLRHWAAGLSDIETVQALFPINPRREAGDVLDAQREAVAWLQQLSPILWGSLPPKD